MSTDLIVPEPASVALKRRVDPDILAKAISDALVAVVIDKNGTKGPDHKIRLQAATLALAYLEGRPIERSESVNVNLNPDTEQGAEDRLRKSPALRASIKALIDRIESGEAIDV